MASHGKKGRRPKDPLCLKFPLLAEMNFRRTSPATKTYNCIAWAAGEQHVNWWPDGVNYWPPEAPVEVTIAAFKKAYETRGYEPCEDDRPERGYEKVGIYAMNGEPTHAARQLPNGWWTSKLGQNVDIEHYSPGTIERSEYGYVVAYMKRKIR